MEIFQSGSVPSLMHSSMSALDPLVHTTEDGHSDGIWCKTCTSWFYHFRLYWLSGLVSQWRDGFARGNNNLTELGVEPDTWHLCHKTNRQRKRVILLINLILTTKEENNCIPVVGQRGLYLKLRNCRRATQCFHVQMLNLQPIIQVTFRPFRNDCWFTLK